MRIKYSVARKMQGLRDLKLPWKNEKTNLELGIEPANQNN